MATSVAGLPLKKQVPLCCGCSKGKQRSVADVSSFTCGSGREPREGNFQIPVRFHFS